MSDCENPNRGFERQSVGNAADAYVPDNQWFTATNLSLFSLRHLCNTPHGVQLVRNLGGHIGTEASRRLPATTQEPQTRRFFAT